MNMHPRRLGRRGDLLDVMVVEMIRLSGWMVVRRTSTLVVQTVLDRVLVLLLARMESTYYSSQASDHSPHCHNHLSASFSCDEHTACPSNPSPLGSSPRCFCILHSCWADLGHRCHPSPVRSPSVGCSSCASSVLHAVPSRCRTD